MKTSAIKSVIKLLGTNQDTAIVHNHFVFLTKYRPLPYAIDLNKESWLSIKYILGRMYG